MATATQEAPSTEPANPLADSLTKVTGINPLSTSTGTASPISYDSDLAFRNPQADIIQISGDPGSGATTAETWSHELALEQLKNQQLEFEYQQQQDLIAQAYQQQQYQLSAQSGALASKSQAAQEAQFKQNYALQQAEAQRQAALAPYQVQSASLANQQAQADLITKQVAADQAAQQQAFNQAYWNQQNYYGQQLIGTPGTTYTYGGASPWYTTQASGSPVASTQTGQPLSGKPQYDPFYKGQPTGSLSGAAPVNSLTGKGIYG